MPGPVHPLRAATDLSGLCRIPGAGRIFAVEVKLSATVDDAHVRHLQRLSAKLGDDLIAAHGCVESMSDLAVLSGRSER